MTEQLSRSKQLFELGQVGMKSFIKEPVRESVREALAEERIIAEDRIKHTHQPESEGQTETRSRFFKPVLLLPVLGLVAAGAIVRRRKMMDPADEKGMVEKDIETTSSHATGQDMAADSDPTEVDGERNHGDFDEATETRE